MLRITNLLEKNLKPVVLTPISSTFHYVATNSRLLKSFQAIVNIYNCLSVFFLIWCIVPIFQVIHSASTRQAPPQQFIPPLNINPSMQRSEYAPPHQQLTPPQRSEYRIPRQQITAPQRVVSQKSKPVVREKIKVVQPPPLYIKAPPPKVMVVDRPRYIPTPPKVIR